MEKELEENLIARVISEYREAYRVKVGEKEYLAKITGKQIFENKRREDYPAVGDFVKITVSEEMAIINEILPRKTILQKKYSNKEGSQIIATNIDVAFIVESVDRDFNLNRFERYFVLVNEGKIKPVIILNKIDLVSEEELEIMVNLIKERFDNVEVLLTSTLRKDGLDELVNYIKPEVTYCFLGSSGVGKSSLINKLLKEESIKTGILGATQRGRHTTTKREMYFLENGGIVIDNPGTKEVGITNNESGIKDVFEEILELAKDCKFSDCQHTIEKNCAVLKAVEEGRLDEKKYLNYLKLKKESGYYEMNDFEKRDKNKKFGQYVKRVLDEKKKFDI